MPWPQPDSYLQTEGDLLKCDGLNRICQNWKEKMKISSQLSIKDGINLHWALCNVKILL